MSTPEMAPSPLVSILANGPRHWFLGTQSGSAPNKAAAPWRSWNT